MTTILHKKAKYPFHIFCGENISKGRCSDKNIAWSDSPVVPPLTLTLISFGEFFFFPWIGNSDHSQKEENWKKRPVLGNYWLPTKRQHFDSACIVLSVCHCQKPFDPVIFPLQLWPSTFSQWKKICYSCYCIPLKITADI